MRTYLRLFRFALPYKWRFVAAILCMSVLAAATSAYVNLLGPALDFLFTGRTTALSSVGRILPKALELEARLAAVDRRQLLVVLPFVIVGVAVVKGLAYFGQFYLMATASQRVTADLRRALFDRLVKLPASFHASHHSGDLISRFSAEVGLVQTAVTDAIATYLRDGLTVAVMLTNCFLLDWKLSLVVFGLVPTGMIPVIRMAKRVRASTGESVATLAKITEIALETLSGIRVVQAFGMEGREIRRFADANKSWGKLERRIARVRALSSPMTEVMAAAGLALAIWWVGGRIIAGQLEPAKFFSFIAAVMLLYQPMKQLGRVGQLAILGAAAGARVFEILDAPSSVPDLGKDVLPPFERAVRLERVRFSYGDKDVLQDVDLEVRKGEIVALVGPSGGGKTTIANLLLRFWDPTGGGITIDGKDLRDVTLASLRHQVALVTQETILFNESVRANIAYGRPDATQEQIELAARAAQAHDFISSLPWGYDTWVGERGVLLSGGQRQRIAIARAVLKNAPLLVLDEATSALDAENEREVQRALEGLMVLPDGRHRTTLVIAHRLSTIRNADRIVVVVDGRIVEEGPHELLLAGNGEYARLWRIFEGEDRSGARAVSV